MRSNLYYIIKAETLKVWSVGTRAFIQTFIINGLQTKLVGFKQNINKSKHKTNIQSLIYYTIKAKTLKI